MRALDGRNNVKVYNLSAGKSLPDWLSDRRKRKLTKRNVEFRHRVELLQDFYMPDLSFCIKMSPDGHHVLAAGTYKPTLKCFDVASLSLKFERCFDADVVQFDILSDDYSKLVILQEDRYVEFHNQGGRWFRMRIPKFGRDLAYHYPSCDMYFAASGNEIYRLNLDQGRFLNSLQVGSYGVNKCIFNPVHYLFTCGTANGHVEAWDPRSRHRVGLLDCALHMNFDDSRIRYLTSAKELGVTALAYSDGLTLAVGTQTGQVLMYDIRSDKPLLVKDHMDGFPIRNIDFHNSEMVFSLSTKQVKIWDKHTGNPYTSIESGVDYNDMCLVPGSGMVFLATEDPKMQTYFIPSIGPAPRWCSHLDTLIEELEEEESAAVYDDYKFVTREELTQLGLQNLIGTNMLRAVMHGYYIDIRLYNKAKLVANPFDYDDFMKRQVKEKISEKNRRIIQKKSVPGVNREFFEELVEEEKSNSTRLAASAKLLLKDDRFSSLFLNEDFCIDKDSEEYQLLAPVLRRADQRRQKQIKKEMEEKEATLMALSKRFQDDTSSDSDSIISSDGEKEPQTNLQSAEPSAIKKRKTEKKKQKPTVKPVEPKENKPPEELNFTSVDSFKELRNNSKKLSRMTLADRLEVEGDDRESMQKTSGSCEMVYSHTHRDLKLQRLRKQQREHHEERQKVFRSTKALKGKLKLDASLI